ncbi:MAG: hypothetical protein ACOX1L_03505 [Erysipelotrichaceae bacterium]|jgi:uncharacterized lipoprotein NlpE involved in copper resistance
MKKLLMVFAVLLILVGCNNKKEPVGAKELDVFAQAYAEEYLEISNLYNADLNYYLYNSSESDNENTYDYFLFCEDECIAKVRLEYTEEIVYGGMSFKWNTGIITGEVLEGVYGDIKTGSEKIHLNDSIEMNYITDIKIEKLEISEDILQKMEQNAIEEAQRYLSEIELGDSKFELLEFIPVFNSYVASDRKTLIIAQTNVIEYVLVKDGEPIYIISFDASSGDSAHCYEFENYLGIDFNELTNMKKVFRLVGGRYGYHNDIFISDNEYLNEISYNNQFCITFIIKKAYNKAFDILNEIDELKIIKTW